MIDDYRNHFNFRRNKTCGNHGNYLSRPAKEFASVAKANADMLPIEAARIEVVVVEFQFLAVNKPEN